jgi:hypothetical protein
MSGYGVTLFVPPADEAMPTITCRCHFVHSLSSITNNAWRTVRDVDTERHWAAVENGDMRAIVATMGLLYECPQCGRLMWKKPGETAFVIYGRESPAD